MLSSNSSEQSTHPRITKRKLDDAISTLDDAFMSPQSEETQPSPKKRAHTSIYSSLTKCGFKRKETETPSRTPMLTALIGRSYSLSRPAKVPNISLPQALTSKPPYRPSSTADFLARLSTYKLTTYKDKPPAVDAVAAARFGWRNEGKDRLVCDSCAASWVLGDISGLSKDAANTLTERNRMNLLNSHKEGCPWRKRQCDPEIYNIPLKGASALAQEVKSKALALTPLVENITIKHPLSATQTTSLIEILSTLPSAVAPLPAPSSSTSTSTTAIPPAGPSSTAIVISLFGWELTNPPAPTFRTAPHSLSRASTYSRAGSLSLDLTNTPRRSSLDYPSTSALVSPVSQDNKHKDATLYCTLCQRRIGLWAYVRASPTSPNGNGRADPLSPFGSPLPPRNLPQPKVLDVLKEHRSFCPYIVKSTPLPSIGGKPREAIVEGWRAVLSVVGRCGMSSRRRRSDLFGGILGLDQSKGEELGMDVDNLVDGVKRGGSKELLRYVKGLLG